MEYAAVIIPTLNRLKHLERCIRSLQENKLSMYTDLYISVDFPPSDKYKKGYEEVKKYVKTILGFKSVNIYYQNSNLGPGLNRKFLENIISSSHDKYVFTDDDNEFSSNFLEYINWGLEKYKNDDSVYAICSTSDFDIVDNKISSDYLLIPAYTPYGTGHWLHKNNKCFDYLTQTNVNKIYKSRSKQKEILKISPMVYMWVAEDSLRKVAPMRGKNDKMTYIDIWENVYCIDTKRLCVIPTIPKSRNWGLDGSGVHVSKSDVIDYVPTTIIDNSLYWKKSPIRMSSDFESRNIESHSIKFAIRKRDLLRAKIIYIMNSLFGNSLILSSYRIIKKLLRKKEEQSLIKYG